jgi:hypothetical protein
MSALHGARHVLTRTVRELQACDPAIPALDWSHISPPKEEVLAKMIFEKIMNEHLRPALRCADDAAFFRFFVGHIEDYAKKRQALALLTAAETSEEAAEASMARLTECAVSRGFVDVGAAIEESWAFLARARRVRERVSASGRLSARLTTQRRVEHSGYCLSWSWGVGCCIAAVLEGAPDVAPAILDVARLFTVRSAREAYATYRRIEWEDALPTEAEVSAARRTFAEIGVISKAAA